MMLFMSSCVISEAITFTIQPEKPYVVVVGVNNTDRVLIWEYTKDAGDIVSSVLFQRNKPDDITPVTLASRPDSSGFTVFEPYRNDYDANLNNRLTIKRVTNAQEYVYTIVINYEKNNVVQSPKRDEVHVVVKG